MQRNELLHQPVAKEEFYESVPRWHPWRHLLAAIAELEWKIERMEQRVAEQSRYQSRPKSAVALRRLEVQLLRLQQEYWRCDEEADLSEYWSPCSNYDCTSGGSYPARWAYYLAGLCPTCFELRHGVDPLPSLPPERR